MYGVIESLHLTLVHLTTSRSFPSLPLKPEEESIDVSHHFLLDNKNSSLDIMGDEEDLQEKEKLNDDMVSSFINSHMVEENASNKSLLMDENV
ncbi:hypothetical protein PENTCL1PPCAC_12461, partial [Pristionchus entomophagus]